MRSALAHVTTVGQRVGGRAARQRASSLSTIAPASTSDEYLPELASAAASILYKSPLPLREGCAAYILNAAAFPDPFEMDYNALLPYVLARLPGEDELLAGAEYEVIFFAGGQLDSITSTKKSSPGVSWYIQAYHVLSRALRKKLQRLYIVHPKTWVRMMLGVFGTIVSPKFKRKIHHVHTLSALALQIPVERLLIPPSVYLQDRKFAPDIFVPYATGRRAFGSRHPLPSNLDTGDKRLPRVLRETTTFLLLPSNVKVEGLFRIPGNNTLSGVLKEAYDRGQRFIVWKEPGATMLEPGVDQELLDEIRLGDGFGVHLAASLIKTWYRELQGPIFPESCYEFLQRKWESADAPITPEDLVELTLPQSKLSPITRTSRSILTRHLLPLLSDIAAHEPDNKMSAENLAIVFSMCLIRGSDHLRDAKISGIVKRVLQAAIEMWPQLRHGMGIDATAFDRDLQAPANARDYEDPLDTQRRNSCRSADGSGAVPNGQHRILGDDAKADSHAGDFAPSLLVRSQSPFTVLEVSDIAAEDHKSNIPIMPKRKPAPSVESPRHSSVFGNPEDGTDMNKLPTSPTRTNGLASSQMIATVNGEVDLVRDPTTISLVNSKPLITMPKRKAVSAEHKLAISSKTMSPTLESGTPTHGSPHGPCAVACAHPHRPFELKK